VFNAKINFKIDGQKNSTEHQPPTGISHSPRVRSRQELKVRPSSCLQTKPFPSPQRLTELGVGGIKIEERTPRWWTACQLLYKIVSSQKINFRPAQMCAEHVGTSTHLESNWQKNIRDLETKLQPPYRTTLGRPETLSELPV